MLISWRRRFVFVHIPKTAGMSIAQVLEKYTTGPQEWALVRWLRRLGVGPFREWPTHTRLRDLTIPWCLLRSFHKFAFVRNPWDRQLSRYNHILKRPEHEQHETVRAMSGFQEFLETYKWAPQSEYITDSRGQIIVDFVGRFESLQQDFAQVCARIGIPEEPLPTVNATPHESYRSYYTPTCRRLVEEGLAGDIECFGYSF